VAEPPDADQKTEAPTPKRRRDSAARGETLPARELGTALIIGAATLWVLTAAGTLTAALRSSLGNALASATVLHDPAAALVAALRPVAVPMLLFAGFIIAGTLAGPMLTARHWAPAALMPKWSRVDPIAGLKRMFSTRIVTDVPLAAAKALLLGGIGASVIMDAVPMLMRLTEHDAHSVAAATGAVIARLSVALVAGLLVIAGIDFPIQLARFLGRLRMSRQEVRDESRESEASPETRAAQRTLARQLAKRALGPALKEATVVVTNPTEFAVALRYVAARDSAPVVVARGRGPIAQAIRELAADTAVPVLRYPALTRAIYFSAQVGDPIRDELYAAVAAVLAFVFNLERQAAAEPPTVEVPSALRFDEHGLPREE